MNAVFFGPNISEFIVFYARWIYPLKLKSSLFLIKLKSAPTPLLIPIQSTMWKEDMSTYLFWERPIRTAVDLSEDPPAVDLSEEERSLITAAKPMQLCPP